MFNANIILLIYLAISFIFFSNELIINRAIAKSFNQGIVEKDNNASAIHHNHCLKAINFYEHHYKLPVNLLHALTVVESGKWHEGYNMRLPWPWALNVEGKPYFFDNKEQAELFLAKNIDQGITSIDIGCGQINWKHHGHYFKKPEYLLNPTYNIAYSAYFLAKNYSETQDWFKAIANYHSRTPSLGNQYLQKVKAVWSKLGTQPVQYNNYSYSNTAVSNKKMKSHLHSNQDHKTLANSNINSVKLSVKQNATPLMYTDSRFIRKNKNTNVNKQKVQAIKNNTNSDGQIRKIKNIPEQNLTKEEQDSIIQAYEAYSSQRVKHERNKVIRDLMPTG